MIKIVEAAAVIDGAFIDPEEAGRYFAEFCLKLKAKTSTGKNIVKMDNSSNIDATVFFVDSPMTKLRDS